MLTRQKLQYDGVLILMAAVAGDGASIAADPTGYYSQMLNNPDQNCQDSIPL